MSRANEHDLDDEQDDLGEQLVEMARNMEAVMQENATLTAVLKAGGTQAGMLAEIKKLTAEVTVLRERNAGLLEEKNEAIRAARKAGKAKAVAK